MTPKPKLRPAFAPGAIPLALLVVFLRAAHGQRGSTATAILVTASVSVVLVSLVWGVVAVRSAVVTVVRSPADTIVGDIAPCEVLVSGVLGAVTVTMTTSPDRPAVGASAGDHDVLRPVAGFRGVAVGAGFEIRSLGPFGLVGARRVLALQPLPQALVIAPRRRPWPAALEAVPRPPSPGETDVRALRPYVDGDDPRLVHWPTSARTGTLAVRDLESPSTPLLVVVDAGDGSHAARTESFLEHVAWVLDELVSSGRRVRLLTMEAGGPVDGEVRRPLDVGRRLAAVSPGAPPTPTEPAPDLVLRAP